MSHPPKIICPALPHLPIGVFDSGIGGLTVLKALAQHFPNESYIYMGDTARLPYGTKSPETVIRYSQGLTHRILDEHVKAIVVACNTASTHALGAVKEMAGEVPVIGMIDPAADAAVSVSRSGRIGVIATYGTIKSDVYRRALVARQPDCQVLSVACQMLVALAEEGWAEGDIPRATLHRYLDPMFDRPDAPDTLILGCTHFPVFSGLLREILGESVSLINSGEAASRHLGPYLAACGASERAHPPRFLVTDDPSRFAENAVKFFDHRLPEDSVELIDI